jgi:transposase
VCPHDGAALREIGVEVSEQMDVVPEQVRVIRYKRVKYACRCRDGGLRLAAKQLQVIPKGLLSEAALAWVCRRRTSTPHFRRLSIPQFDL